MEIWINHVIISLFSLKLFETALRTVRCRSEIPSPTSHI